MSVLHPRKHTVSAPYRLSQDGFTLLELIVAFAIAAILLAFATPSFTSMLQSQSLAADTRSFISALAFARSEAVVRGRRVALCPSVDGNACTNSGNWETGWIIFTDGNDDFLRQGGEPLLRTSSGLSRGPTLRTSANLQNGLAYLPRGTTLGAGGLGTGTFRICNPRGTTQPFRIVVNFTGHVRTDRDPTVCP